MSTRRIALAVFLVAVGIIAVGSAHAQDKPVIAVSNNYQAYAAAIDSINDGKARQCNSKTDALKSSAAMCKEDVCRLAFGILIDKACVDSAVSSVAALPPPQEEKSLGEKIIGGIVGFAQAALPWADRFLSYKTTKSSQEYAYKGQEALYGMFSGVHGQTVAGISGVATAGFTSNQSIANGGFGAIERTAVAAFKDPTYNVSVFGSENNLFGSTSTRTTTTTTTTSTNNCTGGGSGSTTSTTGNPTGSPGGSAPCTISK